MVDPKDIDEIRLKTFIFHIICPLITRDNIYPIHIVDQVEFIHKGYVCK